MFALITITVLHPLSFGDANGKYKNLKLLIKNKEVLTTKFRNDEIDIICE